MGLPNAQLAAAFRKSGKTQDSFCAEQGISVHKLRYHLYKKGTRRNHLRTKSRIVAIPKASPPLPAEFISFGSHPGNNNCTMQRQPVTIITGRFSIAEIVEFLAKTGAAAC